MPLSLRESAGKFHRLPKNQDLLLWRTELLARQDKILLEAVMVQGQSAIALADLMGKTPRMIRHRIHRLTARLSSRRFLDAARALPYLEPSDAALAKMFFCQGIAQREIAKRQSMSQHQLRRRLDRIAGQIKSIRLRSSGEKGHFSAQSYLREITSRQT